MPCPQTPTGTAQSGGPGAASRAHPRPQHTRKRADLNARVRRLTRQRNPSPGRTSSTSLSLSLSLSSCAPPTGVVRTTAQPSDTLATMLKATCQQTVSAVSTHRPSSGVLVPQRAVKFQRPSEVHMPGMSAFLCCITRCRAALGDRSITDCV